MLGGHRLTYNVGLYLFVVTVVLVFGSTFLDRFSTKSLIQLHQLASKPQHHPVYGDTMPGFLHERTEQIQVLLQNKKHFTGYASQQPPEIIFY